MPDYRELYYQLFAALADAVDALEQQDADFAKRILTNAMLQAEEAVISAGDERSESV